MVPLQVITFIPSQLESWNFIWHLPTSRPFNVWYCCPRVMLLGGARGLGGGICVLWTHFQLLAHLSLLLTGMTSLCRLSSVVCQHFQTYSPLKPLGLLKSNSMWCIHGIGNQKFVCRVQVTWPRWPPCPYKVKTLQNSFLELVGWFHETWYVALGSNDDT